MAELDEQALLAWGEGLGVAQDVAVVAAAHVDALHLKDVVDGPGDAQQAAHHYHDHLNRETHGRVARGTRLEVLHHALVDLKHVGFE